jgi:hypothetical protein
VRKKLFIGSCALALAALTACAGSDNTNSTNGNSSNMSNSNAVSSTTTTTMPMVSEDSTVARTEDNGVVTETRTFKSGRLDKVIVTTRGGKRTARVYARDTGEMRDLPEDKVDMALNATGDAIAGAAGFVADKAEDVGRPVVEGSKTAVEKGAEGAKTVGDKTVEGAKTVGSKTAEGARTVGDKTVEGAKTVGDKTAEGAKTVGSKTVEGAKKVGGAVKNVIKH